jgi:cytochrome c peroxidase
MHERRFNTIDEVLDHYSDGVNDVSTASDLVCQMEEKARIPLSQSDNAVIKAFLYRLTDHDFVNVEVWPVNN